MSPTTNPLHCIASTPMALIQAGHHAYLPACSYCAGLREHYDDGTAAEDIFTCVYTMLHDLLTALGQEAVNRIAPSANPT